MLPIRGLRRKSSRYLSWPVLWGATGQRRRLTADNRFFKISDEVREALHAKKPVVALETTIYTHGFPYPENVALASFLESVVRVNGGVPATIGVLDGVARVGLSAEDIIRLTSSAGQKTTLKLSRRDLPYVCSSSLTGRKLHGGTTIAGTMVLAHMAGIKVFATGGLGGVHRGAESSMDISADLTELGRTPVAVISSGCKSFLDIGRTLEYLETEGVGVATFADGREGTVDFPAFWSRDSGVRSPMIVLDEKEAAATIHAHSSLGLTSGLLFANPIPAESSIPKAEMDAIIAEAIRIAEIAGATGKDNTPFILNKIKELSHGKSIPANRALIENNVKRGTLVARELAVLEASETGLVSEHNIQVPQKTRDAAHSTSTASDTEVTSPQSHGNPNILVVGATALDLSSDYQAPTPDSPPEPLLHTSNPSRIHPSVGGVAHNIALTLHHLGRTPELLSCIATDPAGHVVTSMLRQSGLPTTGLTTLPASTTARTPQYIAVNTATRDLHLAMADMSLLETLPASAEAEMIDRVRSASPTHLVLDANLPSRTIRGILHAASAKQPRPIMMFEPVSVAKAVRIFDDDTKERPVVDVAEEDVRALPIFPNHLLDIATPNAAELAALRTAAQSTGLFDGPDWWRVINSMNLPPTGSRPLLERAIASTRDSVGAHTDVSPLALARSLLDAGVPQQALQLLPFIPTILTTLGSRGVLLTQLLASNDPRATAAKSPPWRLSRGAPGSGVGGVYMRLFPPTHVRSGAEVASVNAVGDTLAGAVVAGLAAAGPRGGGMAAVEQVVPFAQRAAGLTLAAEGGVSENLRGMREELEALCHDKR